MDLKPVILDALDKMRKKEVANKEPWKAKAYSTVIKNIQLLDKPVTSMEDLNGIKGIGESIKKKIEEIIETGKLRQAEAYNADGNMQATNELMKIHGIGPAKAKDLVDNHDIKSIDALKERLDLLNDKQKIGIRYYMDFELRIPRKEMVYHDTFLHDKTKDMGLEIVIAGSYRRGNKDSGDIDVLITHKDDPKGYSNILKDVVKVLQDTGYLKETFALGDKKYLGVCKLKRHKHFRRIDIMYCTGREWPFALLYFTGSQAFNIQMRKIALEKGLSLSEHGLKKEDGSMVDEEFKTEEDVFKYLEMQYSIPSTR